MLHPHSLLWHYLWVGPHALEICLAVLIWQRGLRELSPVFFAYLFCEAAQTFTLYVMGVVLLVSPLAWYSAMFAGTAIQALLKIAVTWEVFCHLTGRRPDAARYGRWLFPCVAALLMAAAALAAAHAPIDRGMPIASRTRILQETHYILASGLWLFTFLFAAYFHLTWNKWDFGIAFGSSVSACVHLGTWAVVVNGVHLQKPYLLDFLNMTTYHICVLIWFYYLLSPIRTRMAAANSPPSKTKTNPPNTPAVSRLWPAWTRTPLF
jgi:hypothetical protein